MKNFKLSERIAEISKYFTNVKPSDVLNNVCRLEKAMDRIINPICDKPLSETPYALVYGDRTIRESVMAKFLEDVHMRYDSDNEFFNGILDYLDDCIYKDKIQIANTLTNISIEDTLTNYIKDRIMNYKILSKCISDTNKSTFKDVTDIEYCIILKYHNSDMESHNTHIRRLLIENKASDVWSLDALCLILSSVDNYVFDIIKEKLKEEASVVLHKG